MIKGSPWICPLKARKRAFLNYCAAMAATFHQGAMLKELKVAKAVEETEPGKLRVISRYYMPVMMDPEMAFQLRGAFCTTLETP